MELVLKSMRHPDLDVALIAQDPDGKLAVLSFEANARGGLIRLDSRDWDGRSYESMEQVLQALDELCAQLNLSKRNTVQTALLQTDPSKPHFFLLEPWGRYDFLTAVKSKALYDGQRPVFIYL